MQSIGPSEIVRAGLKVALSLLVIVAFVAIGALVGFVLSLPSDIIGAIAGGGHGGAHGRGPTYEYTVIIAASAVGFAVALAVVWGMWRNNVLSRWFAATSVSALSLFLAFCLTQWQYPGVFVVAALIVPLLAGAYIYTESKAAGRGPSGGA